MYASVPMMGFTPWARHSLKNSRTPYMLPWSVIPSAAWPSATALATRSSRRAAPSSIENSVWTWRCVNESPTLGAASSAFERWIANLHHCDSHPTTRPQDSGSQVGARAIGHIDRTVRQLPAGTRHRAGRQLAHLLELLTRRDLLGEEGGLDAVE